MNIERILVIKNPYTQYEVLHHFREEVVKALTHRGIEVIEAELTLDAPSWHQLFYRNPPDCTLTFNAFSPVVNGIHLADEFETPHVAWLFDAAYYFDEPIESSYSYPLFPDASSVTWMKKRGSPHARFMPHGVAPKVSASPSQPRPYPIVFLGSLIDTIEIEMKWQTLLPKEVAEALQRKADEVLAIPEMSVFEAFESAKTECSSFFSGMPEEGFFPLIQSFDRYLRGKDRIELLRGLKGLPIHIFGNSLGERNWEDFLEGNEGNYHIHPSVDFPQAVEIMQSSQVVLNSSPMFKEGAHERIFYGLGCGACVVTNDTPWIRENFKDGEELLTYRPQKLESLRAFLQKELSRPERLMSMASKGQEKTLTHHTWQHRVDALLTQMKEIL